MTHHTPTLPNTQPPLLVGYGLIAYRSTPPTNAPQRTTHRRRGMGSKKKDRAKVRKAGKAAAAALKEAVAKAQVSPVSHHSHPSID